MYVIKMNDDKSLTTTIPATIYQNEVNADTMLFLIPMQYGEYMIADFATRLDYILPNGEGVSEVLEMEKDPYKNYLQYKLPLSSRITGECGEVELWLTIISIDGTTLIKSGTASITITARKAIADFYPPDKRDAVDRLTVEVASLKTSRADDLVFDDEHAVLQLSAQGTPIGNKISAEAISSGADSVIVFGQEETPSKGGT